MLCGFYRVINDGNWVRVLVIVFEVVLFMELVSVSVDVLRLNLYG